MSKTFKYYVITKSEYSPEIDETVEETEEFEYEVDDEELLEELSMLSEKEKEEYINSVLWIDNDEFSDGIHLKKSYLADRRDDIVSHYGLKLSLPQKKTMIIADLMDEHKRYDYIY